MKRTTAGRSTRLVNRESIRLVHREVARVEGLSTGLWLHVDQMSFVYLASQDSVSLSL